MTPRRILASIAVLAVAIAALAYLRDPAWLLHTESGFREWEVDAEGHRFRWIAAHASFFVASNAAGVTIPVKTTFAEGDWPITVSISIDDLVVDRVELTDAGWRYSRLRLPAQGTRRVRRIDIRANRIRGESRAIQVGEIEVR